MKKTNGFHKRIVLGAELEGYTILTPENSVSRKMAFHRKGTGEKGERFTRDWSIGTEYNSRPFQTIREGLFLIKAGLRKYNTRLYRSKSASKKSRQIFLVGGWRDRFAGSHIHLSIEGKKLKLLQARTLAAHVHDHLPLIIAATANSPVWADEITKNASNRVLKGSKKYFHPIHRQKLTSRAFDEMTYSKSRKTKPSTLEFRVMDSNIPEFVMASACLIKACALAVLHRKKKTNTLSHFQYLRSRINAAKYGMKAKLCWNGQWMLATEYLDRFVWVYREEFRQMDIPHEIWVTFKLLKRGYDGSRILRESAEHSYRHHPQTWQKRFAKKYVRAISELLGGNSLKEFMETMGIKVPDLSNVWLGRDRMKLL